jgi:hypothetical protein
VKKFNGALTSKAIKACQYKVLINVYIDQFSLC